MKTWQWMAIACLLFSQAVHGAATDEPLLKAAEQAYDQQQYAESVRLYGVAFEHGKGRAADYYNAACSASLAADLDRSVTLLGKAIELGYASERSLSTDPDLASLRSDPRWAALLARFRAANPWLDTFAQLENFKLPANQRYLGARKALDGGLQAPPESQAPFLQYYGTVAAFVGDYDTADRLYLASKPVDPVASGHVHARPANAALLALAKGRQAVFINESHGRAQTRAAVYTLLAPMRQQGFDTLAMETLKVDEKSDPAASCPGTVLQDIQLPKRGFPVFETGFYTPEPVDAEIVREAIRLGFKIVGYEATGKDLERPDTREEAQARNLACLLKADPKARLMVIAGFGHISENPDRPSLVGGMMARRFTRLTGIDPLTIDTTSLLRQPPPQIEFPGSPVVNHAEGFVLLNDAGEPFRVAENGYDISLLIRSPASRNADTPSWLDLGGARARLPVDPAPCAGKWPCLIEARRTSEPETAIIADGCVLSTGDHEGCQLFLSPGKYRIRYIDSDMHRLAELDVSAGRETALRDKP